MAAWQQHKDTYPKSIQATFEELTGLGAAVKTEA